jgi:phosphate transport system substrate-binding protein
MDVLRCIGSVDMASLANRWRERFYATSPLAGRLELCDAQSEDAVVPCLAMRRADVGFLTRMPTPTEKLAYQVAMKGDGLIEPLLLPAGSFGEGKTLYLVVSGTAGIALPRQMTEFLKFALGPQGQHVAEECLAGWKAAAPAEAARNLAAIAGYYPAGAGAVASYQPVTGISGRICSVGAVQMRSVINAWMDGFQQQAPDVTRGESWRHEGSSLGMAGLIAGISDIAPSGRRPWDEERASFHAARPNCDLVEIQVARGHLCARGKSNAHAIVVSADNPVPFLSMPQLAQIFGRSAAPLYWRDFGVAGTAGEHQLTPVIPSRQSGAARDFRARILGTDPWGSVLELRHPDGTDCFEKDPGAIAFASFDRLDRRIRALPVALSDDLRPITASIETVASGAYPLSREIFIHLACSASKPLAAHVAEFLRFILSGQGQRLVCAHGYFPLSEAELAVGRARIDRY